MKYKNIFRLTCSLAEYNARGIMGVVREELEGGEGYEVLNVETVYSPEGKTTGSDYYFAIWVGELS